MVNFEPRQKHESQTSDVAARTLRNGPLPEFFWFAKQSARICRLRYQWGLQRPSAHRLSMIEQVAMAGKAHSTQIEVGFGDTAGEHSYFGMGFCPGDFACQHVQFFGHGRIGTNRYVQSVAKRVARRAGEALRRFRAGAAPRAGPISRNFACATHAAFFVSTI
jgi:hypothetical protein